MAGFEGAHALRPVPSHVDNHTLTHRKAGDDSPFSVKLRWAKPEMEARLDSAVGRVDASRVISDQLAELGLQDDESEAYVRRARPSRIVHSHR